MAGESLPVYLTAQGQVQEVGPATPLPVNAPANRTATTVTIAAGAALSGASAALAGRTLVAVALPAGWSAGAVTFQASADGLAYSNVYDGAASSGEYQIAASQAVASAWVAVDPSLFIGASYLKVRSGTSGAPANQAGGAVVTLVTV